MDKTISVLFLGIFCIGMAVYMFMTLKPYNCSLLSDAGNFWLNQCGMFNNQLLFLNSLLFIPGSLGIIGYFKVLRPKQQSPNEVVSE